MQNFTFESPQRIIFGTGEKKALPSVIEGFGRKVCIVTGVHSVSDSGLLDKLKSLLSDYEVACKACPRGEPTSESVDSIAAFVRDFSPDVLVAVGGGSVMDSVKAVSGICQDQLGVEEYLEGGTDPRQLRKAGIPWIAIPTTAGTGAEATKNAVIKSSKQKAKRSLRSPLLLARAAIVDPELTVNLPPVISGISGIDALTQLLEAFVSVRASTPVQSLVAGAFPAMLGSLRRIAVSPQDRDARAQASYGALVSGIALSNSGLGAVHGFASGLGGMYDIPHGVICSCLLEPVLNANSAEIIDKIRFLVSDFQIGKKTDPVKWLLSELKALHGLFGLPKDLKSYGIDRNDAAAIIEKSKGSSMSGNPKKLSDAELEQILLSVI